MISNMAIEIDGVEYLTTAEAVELAAEMGHKIKQDAVTQAAYSGRIKEARKLWDSKRAPWLIKRDCFIDWLENRRSPGRPKIEDEV